MILKETEPGNLKEIVSQGKRGTNHGSARRSLSDPKLISDPRPGRIQFYFVPDVHSGTGRTILWEIVSLM